MASINWQDEWNNMLAGFAHQETYSLGIMRKIFKQKGLSFPSEFKKRLIEASTNR